MDINAKHCLAYLIRFFSLLLSDVPLRLHLSLSLSSILAMPSRHADLAIANLATLRDRDRPSSLQIIDPLCNEEELQCEGTVARSENFHQQRRRRRFRMWVCLIWWMGCGLLNFIIDLVDLGCGFV